MLKRFIIALVLMVSFSGVAKAEEFKTTVYYFHSSQRCITCNRMEKYTMEAVAELKDTKFEAVNTDEPQNKHYLKDYGLYTKSVVITDNKGNCKNLDKIWSYARDEVKFKDYIKSEIAEFESKHK